MDNRPSLDRASNSTGADSASKTEINLYNIGQRKSIPEPLSKSDSPFLSKLIPAFLIFQEVQGQYDDRASTDETRFSINDSRTYSITSGDPIARSHLVSSNYSLMK